MIRPILLWPDKRLKKRSQAVGHFDEKLHVLLEDMRETMHDAGGVGLAAIQIGEAKRALLVNLPDEEGNQRPENLHELINPTVVSQEGEIVWEEGCLSVPEYYDEVKRSERITLEYCNRHGNMHTMDADGFLAVAIQHEIDHLDGRIFVERLGMLKRKKFEKEWRRSKDR